MAAALRLLFVHGPGASCWRAGFDLVQAAAALDVPVELGFAADGLGLILPGADAAAGRAARGAYASLALLGIEEVYAATPGEAGPHCAPVLPVRWLASAAWRAWLRRAPLQVW